MSHELEALDPRTGVEMYLDDCSRELADSTLNAHRSRLRLFVRWSENEGDIENLNDVRGRDIHHFKRWRQNGVRKDSISPETLRTDLLTLRRFLRWAVSVDAVPSRVPENMVLPDSVSRARHDMLDAERAEAILAHLSKFQYASAAHVMFRLFWRCGMRAGGLRALDLDRDYSSDEQYLEVRHRPETGTPLKNGEEGERHIALGDRTCRVLDDHIEAHRPDVEVDGRVPLIATAHGRRSLQSLRRHAYHWTAPCRIGECPHDRDPESCEATEWGQTNKCPSSVSTHPIRRGSITHDLANDVPKPYVSDKMDVSMSVIDDHYDERDSRSKMEQRRQYLDNI